MRSLLLAQALVFLSMISFRRTGVLENATRALRRAQEALKVVSNGQLDDRTKELESRRCAVDLAKLFLTITLKVAAIAAFVLLVCWLLQRIGFVRLTELETELTSARGLLLALVISSVAFIPWPKARSRSRDAGLAGSYTFVDRLLHDVSFRTSRLQIDFSELEENRLAKDLGSFDPSCPVFISGLPRAGTTLLLNVCVNQGGFATHRYSDMPFILLPLAWNHFSGQFRREQAARERAHGDGVMVDVSSPEAFEEILWKAFWKRNYQKGRIEPWGKETNPDFDQYFLNHVRKIIKLRSAPGAATSRYISKNNANIARIGYLSRLFPKATFIIPFRDPVGQSTSLLTQHRGFLDQQGQDPFVRRYMAGIGHHDFGHDLRPLNFDHWLSAARCADPLKLGFWVEYWTAAYSHLLSLKTGRLFFLDYDAFCSNPKQRLERLATILSIADPARLLSGARDIHPAKSGVATSESVETAVLARARETHAELQRRSSKSTIDGSKAKLDYHPL